MIDNLLCEDHRTARPRQKIFISKILTFRIYLQGKKILVFKYFLIKDLQVLLTEEKSSFSKFITIKYYNLWSKSKKQLCQGMIRYL